MERYHHRAHAVCFAAYHVVFVTKHRRPCISPEVGEYLRKDFARLINAGKGSVISIEYAADHVHILAELPIDKAAAKFIGVLKGATSRNVLRDCAVQLEGWPWDGGFWSDSYFLATEGHVPPEDIRQYVSSQRTGKRGRGRPANARPSGSTPVNSSAIAQEGYQE